MGDAVIPSLEPYGLHIVPGYDGTRSGGFRDAWKAWRDEVIALRYHLFNACTDNPEMQARELAICEADPAYFVAMYCWIDEPRPRHGEDPYKPFIPSAAQVDYVQWMHRHIASPEPFDGYTSKSRGWGATRIVVAGVVTYGWRFRTWRGLVVSRKEDLVDKPLDLNSMLGYADFVIDHLPPWMIPEGYDPRYHRLRNMIKNPATGSQVTGESTTTKAGRGARATYAIVDEAAFVPDFVMTIGTLSGTTDHRFALSTEAFEEGFEWFNAWKNYEHDPDKVKQLNWWDNPWFDEYWLAEEEARWEHDPDGFVREVMRDPYAGFGQAVYPIAADLPAIDFTWDPDAYLLVGIDWGRADDTAIVFAQFTGTGDDRKLVWLECYKKNLMPGEFYAHILTGIPPEQGDACWVYWDEVQWERGRRLTFTDRDKAVMRWLRQVDPSRLRVFCDPSGANKDSGGLSWVMRLLIESKRLRQRADGPAGRGIACIYKELFARTDHTSARSGLRKILPNTVFAEINEHTGSESANKELRLDFRNYRFNEPGDKATGQPTPIHDEHSHAVKAAEALANYIDLGVAEPRRLTAGGAGPFTHAA
jgi:hypothetical protein